MPKLDLTRAVQIKTGAGELLQLKGAGFTWARPTPPAQSWGFINNIAGTTGYTIDSISESAVVFTRSAAIRSHLIFNWNLPTGTRLRFRYNKVGPALLWCRTTTDTAGMNIARDILSGSNATSVDIVLNTRPYMGFLTAGNEPAGPTTYTIDQLIVNFP